MGRLEEQICKANNDKYDESNSLEIRKEFEKIRELMDKQTFEDSELIEILETLDKMIGFFDKDLVAYSLIVMHQNFLRIARLRGITNL